jgi:hypothetical protein
VVGVARASAAARLEVGAPGGVTDERSPLDLIGITFVGCFAALNRYHQGKDAVVSDETAVVSREAAVVSWIVGVVS